MGHLVLHQLLRIRPRARVPRQAAGDEVAQPLRASPTRCAGLRKSNGPLEHAPNISDDAPSPVKRPLFNLFEFGPFCQTILVALWSERIPGDGGASKVQSNPSFGASGAIGNKYAKGKCVCGTKHPHGAGTTHLQDVYAEFGSRICLIFPVFGLCLTSDTRAVPELAKESRTTKHMSKNTIWRSNEARSPSVA